MKKIIPILLFLFALAVHAQERDSTMVSSFKMEKNPSTAIYRSLIFPGLGQLYVEQYWKVPIFAGGAGTLIYFIMDNHVKYRDAADAADLIADKNSYEYQRARLEREYYRDNRDMSGFYLLAVYLLATIDAYVGAHLYDFDVSDDLSPYMGINSAGYPSFGISYRFR